MVFRTSGGRAALVVAAAVVLAGGPARGATDHLRRQIDRLAEKILEVTKKNPVRIGRIVARGHDGSSAGLGLETLLGEALERVRKGSVDRKADFEVGGDWIFLRRPLSSGPHRGLRVVKITIRIANLVTGVELLRVPLEAIVDATADIQELLQIPVRLESDPRVKRGTKRGRNEDLARAFQSDRVGHIHGPGRTLVSSDERSPLSVEVRVRSSLGEPASSRAVGRDADGRPFVDLRPGELYELRLHNGSREPVAARVTVDGVDIFHFSKDRLSNGRPRFTHLIVPAGGSTDVVGWHVSISGKKNFLSFLVTALGEGAATKAGAHLREIGVINVQFSRCRVLREGETAKGGKETGFGPAREVKQKAVRCELEVPHDFVAIRYDRKNPSGG